MQTQPSGDLPLSSIPLNHGAKSRLRKGVVTLLALALLAPPALVWGHPGSGGGGGEHASGGGHPSGGGGAHFGGGAYFNSAPRFSGPAPRFNAGPRYSGAAPRFGGAAPRFNGAPNRGYVTRAPAYGAGSRGSLTARAGNAPRTAIGYGAFARAPGGGYGHAWNGGYWHGHYWPPVYYRSNFAWFLPVLPAYCVTYWWNGLPYYYYNEAYYTWNPNDGGYVATEPPPIGDDQAADAGGSYPDAQGQPDSGYGVSYGAPDANAQTPPPTDPNAPAYNGDPGYNGAPGNDAAPSGDASDNLYAYPSNGQSPEQQAQDRRECAQWAQAQSPASADGGSSDYKRALTACLSGRGYSVD